jgi:hypothetical protein
MDRYQASDGTVWFEIHPGRLVQARSIGEADQKKASGASGTRKNEVRNEHGKLRKLN